MTSRASLSRSAWTSRRVAGPEKGAVLIEAALAFPLLVVLLLGLVEFSEALAVNRKLSNAAATVSDLVSQVRQVSTSELDDITHVADTLLAPYNATRLGLVITSVRADKDNRATVAWSYAHGAGATARAPGSALTLPPGLTEAHGSVILAETSYQFTPTIGLYLTGVIHLAGRAYFRPRVSSAVTKAD